MKVSLTPFAIALAAGLLWVGHAEAQGRGRGAGRVSAPRAVVVVGGFRRPLYDPLYDPFYFDRFYRPYYRPFFWYPQAGYGPRVYDTGASVRLQVSPRETEVYIDDYYAGAADDFDGVFQRLHIEPGAHDVTLYLDGFRTVRQRIYLQPTGTFRLKFAMQRLAPGEAAEPRPVEPPPPVQPQQGPPQAGPYGPPPGAQGGYPPPPQRGGPPPRQDGRPQPPPPPGGFGQADAGTMSVRVQPSGAEVSIDGERWDGSSDDERLVVQVSPGVHHLQVRREGYRTYQSDIQVRPGETTTVNVSLSRQ